MNLQALRSAVDRLKEKRVGERLPKGCRTRRQWMAKLGEQREAVNACHRGEITLMECASRVRALGALWPERDPNDPPLIDPAFMDKVRAIASAQDESDRKTHPEEYEPGGPRTLPMVFGGMTNMHYCRDLTPEESKARAEWKAKYGGPEIRESLTLEERVAKAKHERYGLSLWAADMSDERLEEIERAWAALMEEHRAWKALPPAERRTPDSIPRTDDSAPRAKVLHLPRREERSRPPPLASDQAMPPERDRLADYRGGGEMAGVCFEPDAEN